MSVAWGLVSTAPINRSILAAARESKQADVIAVASRDAARAEAYAREHGIDRAYGGYGALLEEADVEAVYISLPYGLHMEWTMRALEAGKHVLCEKPLSRRRMRSRAPSLSPTRRGSCSPRASCAGTISRRPSSRSCWPPGQLAY
jgi:Oxidoreductase family, NAD-binding Rossmann fold